MVCRRAFSVLRPTAHGVCLLHSACRPKSDWNRRPESGKLRNAPLRARASKTIQTPCLGIKRKAEFHDDVSPTTPTASRERERPESFTPAQVAAFGCRVCSLSRGFAAIASGRRRPATQSPSGGRRNDSTPYNNRRKSRKRIGTYVDESLCARGPKCALFRPLCARRSAYQQGVRTRFDDECAVRRGLRKSSST
jgi:hypothetical protein